MISCPLDVRQDYGWTIVHLLAAPSRCHDAFTGQSGQTNVSSTGWRERGSENKAWHALIHLLDSVSCVLCTFCLGHSLCDGFVVGAKCNGTRLREKMQSCFPSGPSIHLLLFSLLTHLIFAFCFFSLSSLLSFLSLSLFCFHLLSLKSNSFFSTDVGAS